MSNNDPGAVTADRDALDLAYDRGLLIDMGKWLEAEIGRGKAELARLDAHMTGALRDSCAELLRDLEKERADTAAMLDKLQDQYADLAADLGGP